ncbi:unnamed protein product [Diplocarpon coronariae]
MTNLQSTWSALRNTCHIILSPVAQSSSEAPLARMLKKPRLNTSREISTWAIQTAEDLAEDLGVKMLLQEAEHEAIGRNFASYLWDLGARDDGDFLRSQHEVPGNLPSFRLSRPVLRSSLNHDSNSCVQLTHVLKGHSPVPAGFSSPPMPTGSICCFRPQQNIVIYLQFELGDVRLRPRINTPRSQTHLESNNDRLGTQAPQYQESHNACWHVGISFGVNPQKSVSAQRHNIALFMNARSNNSHQHGLEGFQIAQCNL